MKRKEQEWVIAQILFKLVPIKKGAKPNRILVTENLFLMLLDPDEGHASVEKRLYALARKHQRTSKIVVVDGVKYKREVIEPMAVWDIHGREGESFVTERPPSSGTELSYSVYTINQSDDVKRLVAGESVRVTSVFDGKMTPQSNHPPFTEERQRKFQDYLKRKK